MTFAEITFCPSINLEQPVMVLVLFLTYQIHRGIRYLIILATEFIGVKRESMAAFCKAAFRFNYISFNIMYLVMHLYML